MGSKCCRLLICGCHAILWISGCLWGGSRGVKLPLVCRFGCTWWFLDICGHFPYSCSVALDESFTTPVLGFLKEGHMDIFLVHEWFQMVSFLVYSTDVGLKNVKIKKFSRFWFLRRGRFLLGFEAVFSDLLFLPIRLQQVSLGSHRSCAVPY